MIEEATQKPVRNRLGCGPSEDRLLGGYNHNVFEINRSRPIVVKILESTVASENLMLSEIEWLEYLPLRIY